MAWFNQADDLCAGVRVACRIGQALDHELRQWSGMNLKAKGVEMLVPCSGSPGKHDAPSIKRARQVMDLLGGAWTHTNDTDGRRSFVQSFEGVRVQVYGVAHEATCTCCDPQEAATCKE